MLFVGGHAERAVGDTSATLRAAHRGCTAVGGRVACHPGAPTPTVDLAVALLCARGIHRPRALGHAATIRGRKAVAPYLAAPRSVAIVITGRNASLVALGTQPRLRAIPSFAAGCGLGQRGGSGRLFCRGLRRDVGSWRRLERKERRRRLGCSCLGGSIAARTGEEHERRREGCRRGEGPHRARVLRLPVFTATFAQARGGAMHSRAGFSARPARGVGDVKDCISWVSRLRGWEQPPNLGVPFSPSRPRSWLR